MSDRLKPLNNIFPAASESDWRTRVETVLKGADFEKKLVGRSYDGLAIQPLYGRRSKASLVAGATSGSPWRVMARVDHPILEEAARLAIEDLEGGADALTLVFRDSASARGYGLSCETITDLDQALAKVQIELIQLRLDPSQHSLQYAQLLVSLVEHRKLAPQQMQIDFGIDPIGTLTSFGHAPWDWQGMAVRFGKTVSALITRGFKGPFLTVDLRPYHEAGASEAQELGAGLAQGLLYLRALDAAGLPLAQAARAISFIVPVDADQFLGLAKLRALRKLWAGIEIACGLTPQPLTLHAETSWRMLSKRDPHVNILRSTIATFAAGIAGADSVTVLPFTSVLGLPDAAARRLARNTSIVLMEESSLWRVTDPAAGAGSYETLTDEFCSKAWSLFQQIESEGGLVQSLVSGAVQTRIAETAKARVKAIATRKDVLTGTSEFANLTEVAPDVIDVKPYRAEGSHQEVLGGETRIQALPSIRSSEAFEALRDRSDEALKTTGKRPGVTLVTIGPLADHAARLAFTRNTFEAGGFAVDAVASEAAQSSTTKLFCLIGSDAAYASDAVATAQALHSANRTLWLAGRPGELEAGLTQAGVARYLFAGCDMVEFLTEAMNVSNS
jgi:methylmalonyl-CoA mutase